MKTAEVAGARTTNHRAPVRSARYPMNGWTREEDRRNVAKVPASVLERASFSLKSGMSGARKAG
jgi:hypothetical protein